MDIGRPFILILFLAFGALLSATLHLAAQQPSPTTAAAVPLPVYDVVAVHENKSGAQVSFVRPAPDAFVATNITLVTLLLNAYNIRPELISGLPGWADSVDFDINAKVSDPDVNALKKLSGEQRRAMMVALLNDRFHLRAHIETKTLPVYDLVIAKGGSKLQKDRTLPSDSSHTVKTPSNRKPGSFMVSSSQMIGVSIPMSMFAANLAFRVERNVIDKTGLTGMYDINLKWRPDEQEPAGIDNNAPDLFTALQEQLGLKLEPSKGPVATLVVDHVERPSAN